LPLPSEETWMLSLASSPISVLEGFWSWPSGARRVFQRDQPSRWFPLDGFMTRWCSTPSAAQATQAKRLAKVPTMILCETRGLQLFWEVRGGIGLKRRLGAELQHT